MLGMAAFTAPNVTVCPLPVCATAPPALSSARLTLSMRKLPDRFSSIGQPLRFSPAGA